MPLELAGVLPIVQTPFDESGQIDFGSLQREVDWAFEHGAQGCGTGMVSEILRLGEQEREELTAKLVEFVAGRGPFFTSVGAESLHQAIRLAKSAEAAGCDAVMAMPPTLTALNPHDVLDYFTQIGEAVEIPLIVQDASSYVGQPIPLSALKVLLKRFGRDKVVFKPEAAPLGPNLSALRDMTRGEAKIFEGSGGVLLIDSIRRGVAGTMPGMEMVDAIAAIWKAMEEGDEETAYRIHFPVASLVALQMQAGLDGFLAIEKYLLVKRDVIAAAHRREPTGWSLDEETTAEVDRLFTRLQQAMAR